MEIHGINYKMRIATDLMGFQLYEVLSEHSKEIENFICSLSPKIKRASTERISLQR